MAGHYGRFAVALMLGGAAVYLQTSTMFSYSDLMSSPPKKNPSNDALPSSTPSIPSSQVGQNQSKMAAAGATDDCGCSAPPKAPEWWTSDSNKGDHTSSILTGCAAPLAVCHTPFQRPMSDPNLMQLGQLKPLDERDVRQDRPPPSPYPGAASDGVQGILQQGVDMHTRLIDHMHFLLANEEDGEEEWGELLQTVRGLLDEMKKTLNFYPDRTSFAQDFVSFRSKISSEPASDSTESHAALNVVIGSYRVDLYRLYFEVIARGGYLKVNQDGSWHQVWEHIGDSGREPRIPLSYEDEAALRNIYVDMLFPFECMNRQRFDCQPRQ